MGHRTASPYGLLFLMMYKMQYIPLKTVEKLRWWKEKQMEKTWAEKPEKEKKKKQNNKQILGEIKSSW